MTWNEFCSLMAANRYKDPYFELSYKAATCLEASQQKLENLNFYKVDFRYSRFLATEFNHCTFKRCQFDSSKFSFAKFNECEFRSCSFINSKLDSVTFNKVKLFSNQFEQCDFTDAKIIETSFNNNSLDEARYDPANLFPIIKTGLMGLTRKYNTCSLCGAPFVRGDAVMRHRKTNVNHTRDSQMPFCFKCEDIIRFKIDALNTCIDFCYPTAIVKEIENAETKDQITNSLQKAVAGKRAALYARDLKEFLVNFMKSKECEDKNENCN